MYVNPEVLDLGRHEDALFVFFHAQRTGGSEFVRWLNSVLPPERIFHVRNVGADNWVQWPDVTAELLAPYRVWAGFSFWKDHDLDRPIVPISNVRHPFYRVVSQYRMSRKNEGHAFHELSHRADLGEYYRTITAKRPHYLNNMSCQRLGGRVRGREPSMEEAWWVIERHFGIVGTTNNLTDTMRVLAAHYGWPTDTVDDPERTGRPPRAVVPDHLNYATYRESEAFEEILAGNLEDYRLYERVRKLGRPEWLTDDAPHAPEPELARPPEVAAAPDDGLDPEEQEDEDGPDQPADGNGGAPEYPLDWQYEKARAKEPGLTVAQWSMRTVSSAFGSGKRLNALGPTLRRHGKDVPFWEAGQKQASGWIERFDIAPSHRVVEYGCGTLRVAGHFIKHLEPGHFFGLDVIPELIEQGRLNLGEEVLAEKRPRLEVIAPETVEAAAEFAPDVTYSFAVMMHVHPDEVDLYADNMKQIAARPGARLLFNATVADVPLRYANRGWAWPVEQITALFAPLELRSHRLGRPIPHEDVQRRSGMFEFVRPD
jgi:SAM-dependent methyltransferase